MIRNANAASRLPRSKSGRKIRIVWGKKGREDGARAPACVLRTHATVLIACRVKAADNCTMIDLSYSDHLIAALEMSTINVPIKEVIPPNLELTLVDTTRIIDNFSRVATVSRRIYFFSRDKNIFFFNSYVIATAQRCALLVSRNTWSRVWYNNGLGPSNYFLTTVAVS